VSVPAWRRVVGVGMAVAGATTAAAVGGLAAQRTLAARRAGRTEQYELGSLRSDPHVVVADDGVPLHVEVDEAGPDAPADAPTLVFVHGYVLDLDCWHFQRAALRGRYRMVFYDQRSHGRSGRSDPARSTIEQLGRDLKTVLAHDVATGPVVLIGHSMGGMSMMALAEQFPAVVAERVVGAAFMSTSAGGVGQLLPGAPGRLLDRVQPLLAAGLARLPWLVETGRRTTAFALTKQLAFGGEVPDAYVVFVDQMIAKTPSDVIWDFFPSFRDHRREAALAAYAGKPGLVVGGEDDHVLPFSHSDRIARGLPRARLLCLDGAGHMAMLECHEQVDAAIEELLEEVETERRAAS
jgi:pimeloyl-ACP methyl ester carboxylesterase